MAGFNVPSSQNVKNETVRPLFDPSYDVGQPALVAFMSSFMGVRSAMNQQMMAIRLKQYDPTTLYQIKMKLIEERTKLEVSRAEMIRMTEVERAALAKYFIMGNVDLAVQNSKAAVETSKVNQEDEKRRTEAQTERYKQIKTDTQVTEKIRNQLDMLASAPSDSFNDKSIRDIANNILTMTGQGTLQNDYNAANAMNKIDAKIAELEASDDPYVKGHIPTLQKVKEIFANQYSPGMDPREKFDKEMEGEEPLRAGTPYASFGEVMDSTADALFGPDTPSSAAPAPEGQQEPAEAPAGPGAAPAGAGHGSAPTGQGRGAGGTAAAAPQSRPAGLLYRFISDADTTSMDKNIGAINQDIGVIDQRIADSSTKLDPYSMFAGSNITTGTPYKRENNRLARRARNIGAMPEVQRDVMLSELGRGPGAVQRGVHSILDQYGGLAPDPNYRALDHEGYLGESGEFAADIPAEAILLGRIKRMMAMRSPDEQYQLIDSYADKMASFLKEHPDRHSSGDFIPAMVTSYEQIKPTLHGDKLLTAWSAIIRAYEQRHENAKLKAAPPPPAPVPPVDQPSDYLNGDQILFDTGDAIKYEAPTEFKQTVPGPEAFDEDIIKYGSSR